MASKKLIIIIGIIFLIGIYIVQATTFAQTTTPTSPTSTITPDPDKKTVNETEQNLGEFIGLAKDKTTQIKGNNVELEKKKEGNSVKTTVKLAENTGSLKVTVGDEEINYSGLKKIDGGMSVERKDIREDNPRLVLDSTGKIIEASFETTKPGKYAFGNETIELPAGSKVYYKDGKLRAIVPDGTKINPPKKIDSQQNGNELYEFNSQDGSNGKLKLENDAEIQGARVIYKNGKLAFSGETISLGHLTIKNNNKDQVVYLDFNGKENLQIPGVYISMNEKGKTLVVGSNIDDKSPGVMLNPNNPFGKVIEENDHYAVQALGKDKNGGGSYIRITDIEVVDGNNYIRSQYDLIPREDIVGNIAINQDNRGIGTFLGDGKFYLDINGKIIKEFDYITAEKSKGVVPGEMHVSLADKDGELTPIYNTPGYSFLIGNNNELGWGPDPAFIKGNPYFANYPMLARGISNRISYNNVKFSKEGFEAYTKLVERPIRLILDSYSASRMTPDQYRMLIDFYNSLPSNKANLRSISILQKSVDGGIGVASAGWAKVDYDYLGPALLRHEATHSATMSTNGFFSSWESVNGMETGGLISDYAAENPYYETSAEFAGLLMYSPQRSAKLLQNKYLRGQMSVMAQKGIISMEEYNYHMKNAGFDPNRLNEYIQEARS